MINAAGDGRLRAMYVMGENPMVADPDINHARHCLEQIEFLVVQDIFLSETAQLAHVVLPGASFAEKDGTFTGTDRRIQRVRKAIEPIGESRPDWKTICQLAERLTQHATRNTQYATRNTQHATRNTQHATRNGITPPPKKSCPKSPL
jgi:predicted molibdopterin-dependent oxidoreductase YjgC